MSKKSNTAKYFFISTFLLVSSLMYSQKQLKYSLTIDPNDIENVRTLITDYFGNPTLAKRKQTLWVKKDEEMEYTISMKRRKIKFVYKGARNLPEEDKLKEIYGKIKNMDNLAN
ncbi:hypothetical protein LS482_12150 [Sinomicrobium kalidii]|uniref:hypothetical protein n=1 Tax=Sinomicrobium kalidii TaxID=2900738 RepID=UPI001E2C7B40|nr:hypothetical protein [Sinomicrobium kalidii]UGU14453.1 hypothetical protein LS482_12150 [Sinomicrobium kalidii]